MEERSIPPERFEHAPGPGAATAAPVALAGTPPSREGDTASADRPRLAEGIELIGEYEDSGFKNPPSLARRADGQVVQLSNLLYTVAKLADGSRGLDQIAAAAGDELGRRVSPSNVRFLVDKRLRPLGVLTAADGSSPRLKRNDPMTALRFRAALIPEGVVGFVTAIFRPLFLPFVVVGVLLALGAMDAYVFFFHGLAQGVRGLLAQPSWFIGLFGLVVASAAFHECGHATACRYGGARPGVMGAGLYIIWPAFYTDVTDAYRLGRGGRLRTDLGGVYFNTIFSLATFGAYLVTRAEPLLVIIALQHLEMAHQFLPSLRLDGYYVVADLTGVPDLFGRIKPVLRSMLPGAPTDPRVAELKTRVRVAVTAWVLITVPAIALLYGLLLINIPRMMATAYASGRHLVAAAGTEASHGHALPAAFDWLQVALLVLPVVGLVLTFASTLKKGAVGAWKRTESRPVARTGLVLGSLAVAAIALLVLGPRGDYRPIRSTDHGTLAAGTSALLAAPGDAASGQPIGTTVTGPSGSSGAAPAPQPQGAGTGGAAPGSAPSPASSPAASPVASPAASPPLASPSP